jgi:hypothetical protein
VTLESAAQGRLSVLALLTLDVVRPFYDLMGLNQDAQAVLQDALRATTLATRKQGPHPTPASFCRELQGRLGAPTIEHVAWWLRYVFFKETQAHVPVENWTDLLRRCHRAGAESWGRLPFPARLSAEAFQRFGTSIDRTEYKRRDQELDDRPLSDWDLHMYASETYDFDEQTEGPTGAPSTSVSLTVSVYQSYLFWAWVLRALTPEQQTKLREKALEIVRTDRLPWIKGLVHPSALDIGL